MIKKTIPTADAPACNKYRLSFLCVTVLVVKYSITIPRESIEIPAAIIKGNRTLTAICIFIDHASADGVAMSSPTIIHIIVLIDLLILPLP
ncbi:MAG: hypothetical protein JW732_00040 [Dehalococcoidia bacterium]|nr:hypothetical protein [Dehalococcoidia bacterium]